MLLVENICLRPICDSDLSLLRSIYHSTREVELQHVNWTTEEKRLFLSSQFNLQHRYYQTHFPEAEFYIVQHTRQDIGRLYIDQTGDELRLIDIALLTAWRNQGIGSSILNSLLAVADEHCKGITLHVEANNPVLSLYQRLGFVALSSNSVYFKMRREPQSYEQRSKIVAHSADSTWSQGNTQ